MRKRRLDTADTLMASRGTLPLQPRERTGALLPAAPDAREEPVLVAMKTPIRAQPLHHSREPSAPRAFRPPLPSITRTIPRCCRCLGRA